MAVLQTVENSQKTPRASRACKQLANVLGTERTNDDHEVAKGHEKNISTNPRRHQSILPETYVEVEMDVNTLVAVRLQPDDPAKGFIRADELTGLVGMITWTTLDALAAAVRTEMDR